MLRPLDRTRRDAPLYPGADRTLRDCFDRQHLLVRIDAALDLAGIAAPLESVYVVDAGRPAIHPEVLLRALLLGLIYQVPSHRQLVERIGENLAWRWFCHFTLDDPVFDHSTLTVFLDRVDVTLLTQVLDRLNDELAAASLFSSHVYLDSSLIPAAVATRDLTRHDPADGPLEPDPGRGTWHGRRGTPGGDGHPGTVRMAQYQDAAGRLPLSGTDPDARWRTQGHRTILGYKEHVIADRSGFILARDTTPAQVQDPVGGLPLLDRLPPGITTLAADTGYRAGAFRRQVRRRGITPSIPLGCNQSTGPPPGFADHGDHLVCPVGITLRAASFPTPEGQLRFRAPSAACRVCPLRTSCVSPSRVAKAVWVSVYRREFYRAAQLQTTRQYERERRRRQTVIEGVFAHLDQLGGTRARVRGQERMQKQGTLLAIAHNLLKAMTKRRFWPRVAGALPRPALPPAWFVLHRAHLVPS